MSSLRCGGIAGIALWLTCDTHCQLGFAVSVSHSPLQIGECLPLNISVIDLASDTLEQAQSRLHNGLSNDSRVLSPQVIIMHRLRPEADEAVEEVVGYILIDLDTPTQVLREFIRRFCGGWLNEHAKVSMIAVIACSSSEAKTETAGRGVICPCLRRSQLK